MCLQYSVVMLDRINILIGVFISLHITLYGFIIVKVTSFIFNSVHKVCECYTLSRRSVTHHKHYENQEQRGEGSTVVVTVDLTNLSCECQRILQRAERLGNETGSNACSGVLSCLQPPNTGGGGGGSTGSKVHTNNASVYTSLCPTV